MDLSTSIDSDLIPSTDGQTGVITRTEVHQAFASSGVGLLVESAGNGEAASDVGLQASRGREVRSLNKDSGRLSAGWDVGAGGRRDAMLDVRTGDRVGVEWLDVEHDGDDVHVKPKPGADVGGLHGATESDKRSG